MPHISGAQETTAEIAGRVFISDSPIAGAVVSAIHIPSGTKYSTTTRSDGRYNLPNLKIGGPYSLTGSFVGYSGERKEISLLEIGQQYNIDLELYQSQVGLPHVKVKSEGQNKIINNSRTGSQEIISSAQLQRLPTFNRSVSDFTRLTPYSNKLSFGGRPPFSNKFTIDGASLANEAELPSVLGTNITGNAASLETFEQLQISLAPYDIRQGSSTGANINIVTRSGTNTFKGSVYGYFNGPDTRGNKSGNIEYIQEGYKTNVKGVSFSGPVIKDKLFFFINTEVQNKLSPY